MTERIEKMLDDIVKSVRTLVDKAVAPVAERMAVVEKAVAEFPTARDGIDGKDGADGIAGKDAEVDYERIEVMLAQMIAKLPAAKDGAAGINGKDGIDGRDGEPGRDAIHLDVLDGIDATRRYQRGTFAAFKGGMIRAYRITDPLEDAAADAPLEKSGWSVVVRGIDQVKLVQGDNPREFAIGVAYTSGDVVLAKFAMPVMIYKGVFRAESKFERGDTVTWDGSLWHCEVDTTSNKPGTGGDWKLAAKHGAPGKDGNSVKGERGPPGADGRDLTQMTADGRKY